MENIPKTVEDPFYRYRRQRVKAVSGKANTTVITNAATICHAIHRPIKVVADYLKSHLSSNVIVKDDMIIIKGSFTAGTLDDAIESYIVDNVLCQTCGNVETSYENKQVRCKACGSIRMLY